MQKDRIYIDGKRFGKTSGARAARRVLRRLGYTWDGHQWQKPWAPKVITLDVRECDIDKVKAEFLHAMAKEPCGLMRLEPYQQVWNDYRPTRRAAKHLHQIAEPSTRNSNTCEMLEALKAVAEKLGSRPYGTGSYLPKSIRDKVMAAIENATK